MLQTLLCVLFIIGKILLVLLLAALVLLILVLLSRMGLRLLIKEDGSMEVLVKVGVIRLNITKFAAWRAARSKPKPPKLIRYTDSFGLFGEAPQKKSLDAKRNKKTDSHKKSTPKTARKPKEKPEVLSLLRQITDFLSEACRLLAGDGRIRIRRLILFAAGAEAADTAILFGHMNTALALLMYHSERFKQFDTDQASIGVYADFQAKTSRMDADIELDFRVWTLTRVAFHGAKTYLAVKRT